VGLNALQPELFAAFTPESMATLCAELTTRVLCSAGRRLRQSIRGAEWELTLQRCQRAAVLGEVCLRAS